jgi:tRNA A37 threonylcarbamoyladenosine synthetase subunit TsaC/SUA5/YrdC
VAVRLADGKELLSDALTTIISNNSTTKMSNLAIRVIRKSVLPLMDIASTLTRTSANMVGQIAGRNYDHKREVVSSKKMITSS